MKHIHIFQETEDLIKNSIFILLFWVIFESIAFAASAPSGLRCELLTNPAAAVSGNLASTRPGIKDASPEFGWIVNSDVPDDFQAAYQIMLATTKDLLDTNKPDMWDSTKTISDNSINVSYTGSELSPDQTFFWKVRTWNKSDEVSDWSDVQEIKTSSSFADYSQTSMARYKQIVTEVKPVSVTKITEGHYLADFGKATFGFLRWSVPNISLSTDASEQTVQLYLGEKILNGRVDRNPGGTIRSYATTINMDGSGQYEIHVGSNDKIPPEFGRVGTYRYVEFINSPYPVTAENITQLFLHNPFDDNAASFVSDNKILNDVWDLCRYSMKETSWCGIFVDGDRERKPYEADAYINQLGYYYVDSDFSIGRYSHEYLMTHPTWPTEWPQHSIMMAWADYLYTGDTESLALNYDLLKNKKLTVSPGSARASDGLIDPTTEDITDWPSGERDGFDFKPINGVVNAFYYHTLTLMEKIADVLGKTSDKTYFHSEAARIYNSYQAVFYSDPDKGGTGLYVDGENSSHSSIHVNMLALAFGLVPEEKKAKVIEFVKNHKRSDNERIACSVYGVQYLLEALYLSGEEDAALEIMTNTTPTSWINMLNKGSTVTLEAWDAAYKENLDWNHAWGAAPANIIPRFIAGIRPVESAFKKTLIHPQPGTLNKFDIKAPTIRGTILLSMDKQANDCTFKVTIPANMKIKFVLPKNCDSFDNITLDGASVTPQKEDSLRYIDSIGSGNHTLVAAKQVSSNQNDSNEELSGYKLVWADEFNKDGSPDPCNWTYERGFVRNQELQWYQPENARCENGFLIIEGRREQKANPRYNANSSNWQQSREFAEYTSSSVITRNLHSWVYGRFEMRGRIDTRDGLWPAFWTLGIEGSWPSNGEIDIMEYYRGMLLANAAWAAERRWTAKWDDTRKPITEFIDPDWSKKFHIWRMDWDSESIKLYVDDLLLNEVDLSKTINQDGQGKNPFHQPHYIILNLAIGGTSGGDPSNTEFPAKFEVDYVRIYQKE